MKWSNAVPVCMFLVIVGCGDDSDSNGSDASIPVDTGVRVDTGVGLDGGVEVDGAVNGGCGLNPSGVATTLDVNGESRSFVLYLPPNYDPDRAYPLVFAWHGLGGNGQLAQNYFGIQQQAGPDAIIVYPDGLPLAAYGGEPGWELNPGGYDFDFFDAMYDHLIAHLCVDVNRVFSTGHSFGGYMSNSLGCYRGTVLAAIAPVAGGPPYFGGCDGPVAAWITHGTADTVVDLSEGQAARDTWLAANGCGSTSGSTQPDPCVAYDGCTMAVHWCPHTGGHEWPSIAAAAIWDFFSAR